MHQMMTFCPTDQVTRLRVFPHPPRPARGRGARSGMKNSPPRRVDCYCVVWGLPAKPLRTPKKRAHGLEECPHEGYFIPSRKIIVPHTQAKVNPLGEDFPKFYRKRATGRFVRGEPRGRIAPPSGGPVAPAPSGWLGVGVGQLLGLGRVLCGFAARAPPLQNVSFVWRRYRLAASPPPMPSNKTRILYNCPSHFLREVSSSLTLSPFHTQ